MATEAPSQRVVPQRPSEGIETTSTSPHTKDVPAKNDSKGITELVPDAQGKERLSQTSIYSEKDSGFSDAGSDDLSKVEQTDSDDGFINGSSKSVELEWTDKAPGDSSNTFTSLTPVYIFKNIIVQQPVKRTQFFQTQMAWNGSQAIDAAAEQTTVILIQPHMTASASNLLSAKRKPVKRTYLPIVKAFARIAPHPGTDVKCESPAPVMPSGKMAEPCKRLRMVNSRREIAKRIEPVLIREQDESQKKIIELPPSPNHTSQSYLTLSARSTEMSIQPLSIPTRTAIASVQPSLLDVHQECSTQCPLSSSMSEAETLAKISRKRASKLKKQQRFHNTVDVLKKSGLLDITLTTKELIGRNKATQQNISELKEHTLLFCEAVKSNDCKIWKKLQDAMNLSSCYWDASGSNPIKVDRAVP